MNKLPTKLLEYLVRQCTREVLNQISEEKEYNGRVAKDKIKVIKTKFAKEKTFKPKIKKISEGDEENTGMAPPSNGQGTGDAPAIPTPKETEPEVPSQPETPPDSKHGQPDYAVNKELTGARPLRRIVPDGQS